MRAVLLLLALSACPLSAPAAGFIAPDPAKALFRRDRLPIDTDTMRSLSQRLTELARRPGSGSAEQLRATAQLLAIAIRLNPANRRALDLGRKLVLGREFQPLGDEQLENALAEVWHITGWLLDKAAGPDGQALGQLVLDALHVVDPAHPAAARHDSAGEAERWKEVVAPLDRFAQPARGGSENGAGSATPASDPQVHSAASEEARPPVRLRQLALKTPLYLHEHLGRPSSPGLQIATLELQIKEAKENGPLAVAFEPDFDASLMDAIGQRVVAALKRTSPRLPAGHLATIRTGRGRHASRNEAALAAPAALLLHAALTGTELREDLVLMADFDGQGEFTRPPLSWDYLRATFRCTHGGRLVVPPGLVPELRSFLVLEEPLFFLQWEILAVDSLDAALGICSKDRQPESLAAASKLFGDVQRVSREMRIAQLTTNAKVRERLGRIVEMAPFHLSASMLLLHGSDARPSRLQRPVLARILQYAVQPLEWVNRSDAEHLDAKRLKSSHESSRQVLDPLAAYLRKADSPLLEKALHLANLARILARSRQLADTLPAEEKNRYAPRFRSLHKQFQAAFALLVADLAPYTGQSLPPPPPQTPQP